MKKLKLISILCAALMVLSCIGAFPTSAADLPKWASQGGTGTAEDPFILNNKNFESWYLSSTVVNTYLDQNIYYKLTEDIDLNPGWTASETAPENYWSASIGGTNTFYSVFDGNGYAIMGVHLKTSDKCGLFYKLGSTSVVKNLRIENSWFECNPKANYTEAGALSPRLYNAVENIYVGKDVTVISRNGTHTTGCTVGGIIGLVDSATATIKNCTFAGTAIGTGAQVGGIVAKINGWQSSARKAVIEDCLNMAKQLSCSENDNVGGIIGTADGTNGYADIINCVSICSNMSDSGNSPADIYGASYKAPGDNYEVKVQKTIVVEGLRTYNDYIASGKDVASCTGWDVKQVTLEQFISEDITKTGGALDGWVYRKNCIPTPTDIVPPTEIVDYVLNTIGIEKALGLTMDGGANRENNDGIRFKAKVNAGLLKSLLKLGVSVKAMGTYVTLAENVTSAESFTPEALTAAGKTYKDISSNAGFYELPPENESFAIIAGSVMTTNTAAFAARAYVTVNYGGQDYTYLAAWSTAKGTAALAASAS